MSLKWRYVCMAPRGINIAILHNIKNTIMKYSYNTINFESAKLIYDNLLNDDNIYLKIVTISSIVMIITGFLTFYATLVINAPYGRYSPKNNSWGPLINPKLAWLIMESPNLIIPITFYLTIRCKGLTSIVNKCLICFFLLHYLHRSIIYPLYRMPKTTAPMPITVCVLAFGFCTWNSFQQSLSLLIVYQYSESWLNNLNFQFGITIAIIGMIINIYGDSVLLKLKKVEKYSIPHGFLFDYISCVNYFGEIIEWIGFGIANWNLPATAFALYTFCNIGTRGYNHHQWYLKKFKEDYPKQRKAVIPFIW